MAITEAELRLMAAAAIIGLKSRRPEPAALELMRHAAQLVGIVQASMRAWKGG